jgi:hypothetical protein
MRGLTTMIMTGSMVRRREVGLLEVVVRKSTVCTYFVVEIYR